LADAKVDLLALEEEKIKGAIRTDFILSAEIIVIALGTVAGAAFSLQATVVSSIALLMTVGVYGLVAAIVKLDDLGLYLLLKKGQGLYAQCQRKVGQQLLAFAPKLMRSLTVIGTLAMFMVGGSIIGHGFPLWHHGVNDFSAYLQTLPIVGTALTSLAPLLMDAVMGVLVGAISLALVSLGKRLKFGRS
jgi:predicted DNA repair protein MutK